MATEPARPQGEAVRAAEFSRVLRFLAAGAANTLLTLAVYQAALFFLGHTASYAIAYGAGILFAYYAYAAHVFGTSRSARRLAAFAVFYVLSLAAGTALNDALIERLGIHPRVAVFITIAAMLPVNYLGSKRALRG